MLSKNKVREICENIKSAKIGLIGDFCVDIYWRCDMTRSELSRETPHFPLPVTDERFYLGAGGNVASNIGALHPAEFYPVALYGNDWRGMLMESIFRSNNMNTDFVIRDDSRFTNAYCKPMRRGISETEYEDPRIDFDNYTPILEETEQKVIDSLHRVVEKVDVLCVADQFKYGIITDKVRAEIIKLAESGLTVIADSRYNIAKFTGCIIKPNEVECWRAVYSDEGYKKADTDSFTAAADKLAVRNNAPVLCTLGAKGSFFTDGSTGFKTEAVSYTGEIDICGAGDTSLSAFSCALAAGASYRDAAAFAALASGVTVRKIGVTGTASPKEIEELAE